MWLEPRKGKTAKFWSCAYVGGTLVIGATALTPVIANIDPPSVDEQCPSGSVVGAFLGRAGMVTDQIAFRCDAITTVIGG